MDKSSWHSMIDVPIWRKWHGQNFHLSVYASLIYVTVIFSIKFLMRNKSPFSLKRELILWNLILSVFSILTLGFTFPEFWKNLSGHGLHASLCERQNENVIYGIGLLLMAWSKLAELGDTLFIVLRKQKLIFLHWYHHITVMLYIWEGYERNDPSLAIFMVVNLFIHSIMYTYYFVKAMKFPAPKFIAMGITALQLIQMMIGVSVNIYSLHARYVGAKCDRSDREVYQALGMYATYLVLFGNFFYRSYFGGRSSSKLKTN